MTDPIMAIGDWKTNAELIVSCRDLGYLDDEHEVWDSTINEGKFWRLWRPAKLVGTDIDPKFTDPKYGCIDATNNPFPNTRWHHVVFDPPYKLNGTPSAPDVPYGVHVATPSAARLSLIEAGTVECARVLGDGYLLVKVQDMVVGGRVRWQTDLVTKTAEAAGLRKVDALLFRSYRPQDPARGQQHARRNYSTMLVFTRDKPRRRAGQTTMFDNACPNRSKSCAASATKPSGTSHQKTTRAHPQHAASTSVSPAAPGAANVGKATFGWRWRGRRRVCRWARWTAKRSSDAGPSLKASSYSRSATARRAVGCWRSPSER